MLETTLEICPICRKRTVEVLEPLGGKICKQCDADDRTYSDEMREQIEMLERELLPWRRR
jgi:hypothetical protein